MRRGSHDMQVNVAGIRRNIKNFAHNYSDAQKKVREATSNDPWGPSSTIMAEIADLTYNVVAFSEIMQMVWKRLNDHGRNWRHVYKALVLLEYLIKTGSEKVGQQCKENIFAIQTLKDFQHFEEGKDQGQNVREKAKQLCNLLKDDERLKNERARALKAKERFAQSASGFGSDGGLDTPCSPKYPAFRGEWGRSMSQDLPREIENARPQTAGEEELQLQLALAMSREEADQEEQKRKSDDVRLQLALSQSQQDFKTTDTPKQQSHMVDLLDVNLGESHQVNQDPWGMPQPPRPQSSPWQPGAPLASPPTNHNTSSADPWQPAATKDPWGGVSPPPQPPRPAAASLQQQHDPWSPASQGSSSGGDLDDFDVITNRKRNSPTTTTNGGGNDPFVLNLLDDALQPMGTNNPHMNNNGTSNGGGLGKKTPQSFLGENSALVNLDNLVTSKPVNNAASANPFSDSTNHQSHQQQQQPPSQRPVFNAPPPKPTINEMKQASFAPFSAAPSGGTFSSYGAANASNVVDPWAPVQTNSSASSAWMKSSEQPAANPFLS